MSETEIKKPLALITGASRGIGASIAKELAKSHYVFINFASSESKAKEVGKSDPRFVSEEEGNRTSSTRN